MPNSFTATRAEPEGRNRDTSGSTISLLREAVVGVLWYALASVLIVNAVSVFTTGTQLTPERLVQVTGFQGRVQHLLNQPFSNDQEEATSPSKDTIKELKEKSHSSGQTTPTNNHVDSRPSVKTEAVNTARRRSKLHETDLTSDRPLSRLKKEKASQTSSQESSSYQYSSESTTSETEKEGRKPGYRALIQDAARSRGIDPEFVKAIAWVESRGNPRATSSDGAMGIMQLMPATAQRYERLSSSRELYRPEMNVQVGTRHLAHLKDLVTKHFPRTRRSRKAQFKLIAAAYNAGWSRVQKYQDVPPFSETQVYVDRVWAHYLTLKG